MIALLNADALRLPLADGIVHCVVTSPPYWGLRKYGGDMGRVWGGDPACAHEWGEEQTTTAGRNDSGESRPGFHGQVSGYGGQREVSQGQFCRLCGAWYGELGLEPDPDMFIDHMVSIFREVGRVMRDDATLWLNLGDSYAGSWGAHKDHHQRSADTIQPQDERYPQFREGWQPSASPQRFNLKPLDLCNIPHRVAAALQADGWYWRSTIVWSKPNPMPESVNGWRWERCRVKVEQLRKGKPGYWGEGSGRQDLDTGDIGSNPWAKYAPCPGCEKCADNPTPCPMCTTLGTDTSVLEDWLTRNPLPDLPDNVSYRDHFGKCPMCNDTQVYGGLVLRKGSWRPTNAHEYIFLLTKGKGYFADADAVRREISPHNQGIISVAPHGDHVLEGGHRQQATRQYAEIKGANARSVWEFATAPYSGAHFATFPPELPRRCIKAGTSEAGVCRVCGAPWARVVNVSRPDTYNPSEVDENIQSGWGGKQFSKNRPLTSIFRDSMQTTRDTLGFRATCEHTGDPVPATVFDPFGGSGTTALVARELGRNAIITDLSFPYLRDQARSRLGLDALEAWTVGASKNGKGDVSDLPLWSDAN